MAIYFLRSWVQFLENACIGKKMHALSFGSDSVGM